MAKEVSVTLTEDQVVMLKQALRSADELCSAVISGRNGQMKMALAVVSALTDIKRNKVLG